MKQVINNERKSNYIIKCFATFILTVLSLPISAQSYPYQNPALSPHERAVDLCHRLTLQEKASLMCDESPAIPRLGIKKFFWWSEALHGAANMGNVTVFPEPIAMAASFNNQLLYQVFSAVSDEMRAQYNLRKSKGEDDEKFHGLSVWTPNINIFRDPRWGRGQETYGEDPYLTSVMGTAVVRGLQGPETSKYRKLLACAKHFAVHSGPEWSRHTANLNNISPRDLWETYLPAFKTLVQDAKVREVMCAYQRIDDEPCCGNNRLLQQILRNEWGYKYLVVSDCGAISDFYVSHKTSSDATHAAAKGALSGTDVECGYNYAYKKLPDAVNRGLILEKNIDEHVVRLLEGRFELGEMDDPSLVKWSKIPASVLNCKQHKELSLDMARQAMVLLQNKNNILPLKKKKKIAVIGPNADNQSMMWGNYNGTPNHTVTILDGILSKTGKRNVTYYPGCDLTNKMIVESLLNQCSIDGHKGIRGTFWNNKEQQGKIASQEFYTNPIAVTTAGQHVFANGVNMEDFSAKYETIFTPKQSEEAVIKLESCGDFQLLINGKEMVRMHTWRTTPTSTAFKVEKGQHYKIEVNYKYVNTWGSNMKLNIGIERPINYSNIIAKLKGINTVVFVGGISSQLEGEEMPVSIPGFKGGDRTNIELPDVQRNFLKSLKQAGKKVIFVDCSGSAIALTPETKSCDAILQAWYSGEQGGNAVADVLFGDVNPSGKLPITFYRNSEQLPDFTNYSMQGRTYRYMNDPLFAFGYGLSYTNFKIGKAKLMNGDTKELVIPVSNIGPRKGTEVVQVYIRNVADTKGPLKSLKAFKRVSINAGETTNVRIPLTKKSFELFDPETNTVRVKSGKYEIMYGSSSRDVDLKKIDINL